MLMETIEIKKYYKGVSKGKPIRYFQICQAGHKSNTCKDIDEVKKFVEWCKTKNVKIIGEANLY